ncbi:MAG TPA: ABC transporter ATP-binding protein [Burkholderiales bacterium]|nr:ABC transporter ATP-binding protein [Burkholderiales bacterium]
MLLRAENLSKHFGGVAALQDVALELECGIVHSIIGPNGAGKTTLLNLLCGIYLPDSGRILFEDAPLAGAPHEFAAAGVGRTFQSLQVFFNMSALENVMAGRWQHERCSLLAALLRLPPVAREERRSREAALELLELVGLARWASRASHTLPYGALKRLEIARALGAKPRLLLLDEPAAGLNPTETRDLDRLIREIAARGITVVLVEHNMKLVMELSQHVVVLNYGRKLAEGEPRAVSADPRVVEAYLGCSA